MTRLTAGLARKLDSGTQVVLAEGLIVDARYAFKSVIHIHKRKFRAT
jgi:hypothetical protein